MAFCAKGKIIDKKSANLKDLKKSIYGICRNTFNTYLKSNKEREKSENMEDDLKKCQLHSKVGLGLSLNSQMWHFLKTFVHLC